MEGWWIPGPRLLTSDICAKDHGEPFVGGGKVDYADIRGRLAASLSHTKFLAGVAGD